jgi:16S rRNA (uracil1498-N3)-methyltransferase
VDPPHFYCPTLTAGVVTLDAGESDHALRSRRLGPGDAVVLFDGRGHVAPGVICGGSAGKSRTWGPVQVEVSRIEDRPRPESELTLVVAACKGPRLDWMVEKCTELGVARILLAEFERSVVRPGSQHVAKLRRAAIEACKQSGRPWLPVIEAPGALPVAIELVRGAHLAVAHLEPGARTAWSWQSAARRTRCAAVIGPEGGLTASEAAWLTKAGGELVCLGPYTLRVETAAVAFASLFAAHSPSQGEEGGALPAP